MASPQQVSEMYLQVRRVFAAPREKVYRAWVERTGLEQWMCFDMLEWGVEYREVGRIIGDLRLVIGD